MNSIGSWSAVDIAMFDTIRSRRRLGDLLIRLTSGEQFANAFF